MEEVMPPWASLLTYMGLAGLVVLSLMRGWIVPRTTVDKIVERLERAIDDRDSIINELRAQCSALDKRNDLLAGQIYELVSSGYAAPPPIRATATAQAYQEDGSAYGVLGSGATGGQTGSSPRGGQARGNGKARRKGAGRR